MGLFKVSILRLEKAAQKLKSTEGYGPTKAWGEALGLRQEKVIAV